MEASLISVPFRSRAALAPLLFLMKCRCWENKCIPVLLSFSFAYKALPHVYTGCCTLASVFAAALKTPRYHHPRSQHALLLHVILIGLMWKLASLFSGLSAFHTVCDIQAPICGLKWTLRSGRHRRVTQRRICLGRAAEHTLDVQIKLGAQIHFEFRIATINWDFGGHLQSGYCDFLQGPNSRWMTARWVQVWVTLFVFLR